MGETMTGAETLIMLGITFIAIIAGGVTLFLRSKFNLRGKTSLRVFIIVMWYGSLKIMEMIGDDTGIIGTFFVIYVIYAIVTSFIGWIYYFVTGGERITFGDIVTFILGWKAYGTASEFADLKKKEMEAKIDKMNRE